MLTIDRLDEALAIHRALLELRQVKEISDSAVHGSQLVADFAHRLLDWIESEDAQSNGRVAMEKWRQWRLLSPKKPAFQVISSQLSELEHWKGLPESERIRFVRNLCSPYHVSEQDLATLASVQ